jgi:hypothetical protein
VIPHPALLISGAFLLSGCGSSSDSDKSSSGPSYTGAQTAATVSTNNQQSIAVTAREGAVQAVFQSNSEVDLPLGVSLSTNDSVALVNQVSADLVSAGQLPTGVVSETVNGDCGGTARIRLAGTSGNSFRIDYNNFCMLADSEQVVVNGRVDYTTTETSTTIVYRDVTITSGGVTETINMTIHCDDQYECTYSADFVGSDGRVYRSANVTVSGDSSSGYDVSARIYDPEYGYVDIQGTGLTLCSGGGIGSGSVNVTDSTGTQVLTVDFTSCDSMTVTFNGTAEVYSQ